MRSNRLLTTLYAFTLCSYVGGSYKCFSTKVEHRASETISFDPLKPSGNYRLRRGSSANQDPAVKVDPFQKFTSNVLHPKENALK
jgi:hypothetical protein